MSQKEEFRTNIGIVGDEEDRQHCGEMVPWMALGELDGHGIWMVNGGLLNRKEY